MIKEAVGFGATIDEAKENALRNLGASDFDDVQYEVVSMPKKKVLGMFGGKQAEVKAFIEIEEKKTIKPKKNQNKQNSKKDKKEKAVAKKEKPAQAEIVNESKPEVTEKND